MYRPVKILVESKSAPTGKSASGRTRQRLALDHGLEDWAAAQTHNEKRQVYEPLFVGIGVSGHSIR